MITSIEWFYTPSRPVKSSQPHTSPPLLKHARAKTKTLTAAMTSKNQGESDPSPSTKLSISRLVTIKGVMAVVVMRQLSRFMEGWAVASPPLLLSGTMGIMCGRILRMLWGQVGHRKGQVSTDRSLKCQPHQLLTARRITHWFVHPRAWLNHAKTCPLQ